MRQNTKNADCILYYDRKEDQSITQRYNHMKKRIPFPKKYWVYLIIVLIGSVLLIVNIFRTDSWTVDIMVTTEKESF